MLSGGFRTSCYKLHILSQKPRYIHLPHVDFQNLSDTRISSLTS